MALTKLKDAARELRKRQTESEDLLWFHLRGRRFRQFRFKRQKIIGPYVVDFYCYKAKLIIELDGQHHAEEKNILLDEERTKFLNAEGYKVIRFWNSEVIKNTESVLMDIWEALTMSSPTSALTQPSPTSGRGKKERAKIDFPLPLVGEGRVRGLEAVPEGMMRVLVGEAAYSHLGQIKSITPLSSGLINKTFIVETDNTKYILQEVSNIFKESVHDDILAVTQHLKKQGLLTPELLPTNDDKYFVKDNHKIYRALTYINGKSFDKIDNVDMAFEAGLILGKFHRALKDFQYNYHHKRVHGADFKSHLGFLKETIEKNPHHEYFNSIKDLVLLVMENIEKYLHLEPTPRHAHGDLKISNILFNNDKALCLVDLDTLGYLSWSQDLADAWRSWGNPKKEDEPNPKVDLAIIKNAILGYLEVMKPIISKEELHTAVMMAQGLTLCLGMRYLADVINESYFAFDNSRFMRSAEHNLLRATAMWQLYNEFVKKQAQMLDIININ